jgi:hypothetical protein
MTTTKFALRISTSAALIAALACAPAAFASEGYIGNPPQVSTPEEKAETAELNRSQMNGTLVPADKLNGVVPMAASLSTETAAADAIEQEREAQVDARYQAAQDRYQRQLDRAARDRARYEDDLRHHDQDPDRD